MAHQNDVVLTGPPRSGTTLTCELLNEVADTVALDEPMDRGPWLGRPARTKNVGRLERWRRIRRGGEAQEPPPSDPDVFCDLVGRFFDDVRRDLLAGKGAITLNYEGRVRGDKFSDRPGESGYRERMATRSVVAVDKPLSPGFVLVVKHIAGFTATLPQLSERFRCYAIIRNPLSTLCSWQTVTSRFREGRVPRGERLDEGLRRKLAATPSAIDRQFVLLHWFYDRFTDVLPHDSVIRYEDIVASGGRALETISPAASHLDRPLSDRNRADVYDRRTMKELGERILAEDGRWWRFYSPQSVRDIMEAV